MERGTKPAGIAAAVEGAKQGAGVEDIYGGMVDVGTNDYAPGGEDEQVHARFADLQRVNSCAVGEKITF